MYSNEILTNRADDDYVPGPTKQSERENYKQQYQNMFGDTPLPAIVYKGKAIPERLYRPERII
jgi:hypothetical protein